MTVREVNKHFNFNSAAINLLKLYKQGIVIRKQEKVKHWKRCLYKIK